MDRRSTVLVLSLVGAIIAGMFASNAIKQAQGTREATKLEQAIKQAQEAQEGLKLEQAIKQAQEVSKLEQQGFTALRQFEFQELEALLTAMEAGQRLKELVKDGRQLEKYPASSPILALQTILDNIHERTQLTNNQGNFRSASFSPDGTRIVTAAYHDRSKVWDTSGKLLAELKGHTKSVESASFSPDGQHILTSGTWKDETIRMWNLSGRLDATFKGWRGVFSPDGKRIITTFKDKPIAQVWDLSGRLITELKGHQDVIMNASFSPDGQRIITESADNTARVWDLSGKVLAEIKEFDSKSRPLRNYKLLLAAGLYLPTLTFSPNGQRILTVNYDNTVRLWDLSGKLLTEKKYQDRINEASFSPDGQRILIAFYAGTAHVLDLSGRQLAELKGHQDSIYQASFSPDGQRILTASSDNTVRLWDLSGRLLAELKTLDSRNPFINDSQRLKTAFFSQDGKQIVAVFDDGTIRVWQVGGLDELLVRGCDWLKDYLATHPEARERLKVCQQQ